MSETVEVFTTLEAADAAWREFEQAGELYIYQTRAWAENWYTHIGQAIGAELCLVSVRDTSGKPLYFFPFTIERRGPLRVLAWLGGVLTDYGAPIVQPKNPGDARQFARTWQRMLDALAPVDVVWLTRITPHINGVPNPMTALPLDRYHSAAYPLALTGDWEGFYEAHAGAKTRSTDRRKERRLAGHGDVAFAKTDGGDGALLERVADAMLAQKQAQYREMHAPNVLAEAGYREFFRHPVASLIENGSLHLSALTVGGRIATTHWGMTHHGRFYYFMPSLASGEWAAFSPGRLLLFHLFQWCFQNGIEVFDFTVGDESYKRDWCDMEMPLRQYFKALTFKGKLYGAWYRARLAVLNNDFTRSLARNLRKRFH